ncbi:tRNA (adenosine(37)-N6)-dimethylallyltransferase MiaA [Candidatus Falkowbacteria bacterium]|jgi:tRNA dimethylallyltransferase|nr:tRNA (adenosine(37)-N6)-dimethylallyltransferase MiaA [Candidatus Falkowbacteria bacterium]MBT6573589.1 tRNA (adenosine(37)-N6)-dimethylallyltransferase MiaA [Candidatus Falkowbacteria bacterium]MBT7348397.1 tRNA (adenosine(37)-N6)-dimethylallyltransferase MiaA [Candidatus Falkowbacteria bacterium]MBT7500649.1 tRNA (adenosine(37)-N6)-dimethylallyltransferase MiaA [Candidatus Falkowbacteria bacterium]
MNKKKQKVIIVLGPTASGKSGIALKLAKQFNGFLISADSRQVYKQMDIGTNKDPGVWKEGKYYLVGEDSGFKSQEPGKIKEQGLKKKNLEHSDQIQEYMVDIIEPNQEFSLDDWLKQVKQIIKDNPSRMPIIVGGTGLYISALVNDYQLLDGFDEKLRARLEKQIEKKGIKALLSEIREIDPGIENKIDTSNSRRVVRAAEIILKTKKPLEPQVGEGEFEFLQLGIALPREELYAKIDKRVDQMMKEGLVEEVKSLIKKGYDCSSSSMSGIGYRQVCQFLNNEINGVEAVRLVKRDTRRYAKRQLTWFKRDKTIHWIKDYNEANNLVNDFI